jgi:hypothetical protein
MGAIMNLVNRINEIIGDSGIVNNLTNDFMFFDEDASIEDISDYWVRGLSIEYGNVVKLNTLIYLRDANSPLAWLKVFKEDVIELMR